MPFNREGQWVEPTREDVAEWVEGIVHPSTGISSLPEPPVESRRAEALSMYEKVSKLSGSLVSIVIPVYNGYHLLSQCLEALRRHTTVPHEIILIDDASTDCGIEAFVPVRSNIRCVEHKVNQGFAAACNTGIEQAKGDYICILNTDVLVTTYWAEKLILALQEPNAAIANPVTNNTAMIALPMFPGYSYLDMNRLLEHNQHGRYPEIMPTGFCMMFRSQLWQDVGPFDEAYVSYGEESDWWMRVLQHKEKDGTFPRYKAVLADDCYVFHQRGGSFSQLGAAKHNALRHAGSARFRQLHPEFQSWMQCHDVEQEIDDLARSLVPFVHDFRYNLCYVVRSADHCGAMDFITDIVNRLIEENVNAKVAVIKRHPTLPETWTEELHTRPIFFNSEDEFLALMDQRVFSQGILVAGSGEMLPILNQVKDRYYIVLHAQSYEPDLAMTPQEKEEAEALYKELPDDIICVSNPIRSKFGSAIVINPGVRKDIFHRRREPKTYYKPVALISMDDRYWFKGYAQALKLLELLVTEFKVFAYGIDALPEVPGVVCLGRLTQEQIADVLQDCTIFIDPALVHSYGLPAKEAEACGVPSVALSDLTPEESEDPVSIRAHIKSRIEHHALSDLSCTEDRKTAIINMVEAFDHCSKYVKAIPKAITVVTPHLRKHGGPTTIVNLANILAHIGHKVTLVSCYDDFRFHILDYIHKDVKIHFGVENIPSSYHLIVNSDNPFLHKILESKHQYANLLKLSHNERFKAEEEASLQYTNWNTILCSTDALADKVIHPTEGWDYPAHFEPVVTLGWYHYDHPIFDCPPDQREYAPKGMRICTLMHHHHLKGSKVAMAAMYGLRKKYGDKLHFMAVGEMPLSNKPDWLHYYQSPTRQDMASILQSTDIWLGASYTEGLGRMGLEAMSAGAAVVQSDTGCEYAEDGVNCLIYPVGNAQKAAERVDELINERALLDKLVRNGYDTACKHADPTSYISRIRSIIC